MVITPYEWWTHVVEFWILMVVLSFLTRPLRPLFEFISNITFLITLVGAFFLLICLLGGRDSGCWGQ